MLGLKLNHVSKRGPWSYSTIGRREASIGHRWIALLQRISSAVVQMYDIFYVVSLNKVLNK